MSGVRNTGFVVGQKWIRALAIPLSSYVPSADMILTLSSPNILMDKM